FLDELELAKAAAERLPFLGIGKGMVETGLRKPEGAGRQEEARGLIALVQNPAAAVDFADHSPCRKLAVIEIERARIGRAPAHFFVFFSPRVTRRIVWRQEERVFP